MRRLGEHGPCLGHQWSRDHRGLRAAVSQEVQIVGTAHQRVHRNGHGADLDGAPERAEELGRVEAQHEDAVLHLHAELTKRVARPVDEVVHVAIAQRSTFIVKRGGVRAALLDVAIDEPRRDVELCGQCLPSAHGSAPSRSGSLSGTVLAAFRAPRRCGMKALFAALLGVAVLAAPVSDVLAQGSSSSSSSTSAPAPQDRAGGSASGSVSTPTPGGGSGSASGTLTTPAPGGSTSGSVGADRSSSGSSATKSDDGAALPRSAVTERTTIFGLSPTAAVLIAAALLLVVILAIVAMTRSNDTYVDQRRL